MNEKTARKVVDALHGLALGNWADFSRDPSLARKFVNDIRNGNFRYVEDKFSGCGGLDCWSTYRDLKERYKGQPVLFDCEDIACAYAACLAFGCYQGIYVGLVPGQRVSHAIAGASKNGEIRIIDPSRWFGMAETHYQNPVWKKLR